MGGGSTGEGVVTHELEVIVTCGREVSDWDEGGMEVGVITEEVGVI